MNHYKKYGFKDRSAVIRAAPDRLQGEFEKERLRLSVVPITEWSEKKGRIVTNVALEPAQQTASPKSVADCLQTRPLDHRFRLDKIRGKLDDETMRKIDQALKKIFNLN